MRKNTFLIGIIYLSVNLTFGINPNTGTAKNNIKETKDLSIKNTNMANAANKKTVLSYLKKYEEKDLKGIEDLFSDDIILRDWKIRVTGKEKALSETRKNFESVDSIKIEVLSTYENENTVAAELKITINNKEELYVIDVVSLNAAGKINSIKAFIGRGDN